MDKVELILVMSVNPVFGGQSFTPTTLDKLCSIRERISESGRNIRLEVDSTVKVNNIKEIPQAGVDMFIAGSANFDNEDNQQAIDSM